MGFKTTDLCDQFAGEIQIAEPIFRDFGGLRVFHGPIVTLKVYEDNSLLRAALEEPGAGRVLVVDGGGSMHCALLGEQLAELALNNGWAGLVINGCIRDSTAIAALPIGVRALATHPARSAKRGIGERDNIVRFAGISFLSGEHAYLDEDGLVVSKRPLF